MSQVSIDTSSRPPIWRPGIALISEHSGLIRSLVRRDLSNRYKGSLGGWAWAVITPAVMIVIFTVIFSGIFQARFGSHSSPLTFALYLFCGLLPWIAFSEGIQRSTTILLENVNLIKRVVFPIEALPVNVALSGIVQQLVGTFVLLVANLALGGSLHATVLLLPVLLVVQLMATLGLAWLAASLGVFLRDVSQASHLVLQTWLYLTPVFYPEEMVPPRFHWLVRFNPMAPLIRSYRRILIDGIAPDWVGLGYTLAFGVVCLMFGYWWFERTKKAFADVI